MDKENSIMGPSLYKENPALPFEENSASRSALPFSGSCVTMAAECEGKGGKNMGRDMAKKYEYDYNWSKDRYIRINLRIRNDSGIPEAIERVKETGESANSYILATLRRQLIADGYLQKSAPSNETESTQEE